MKALTPSQTKEFIINCLKIKEIPYISGPPGIGKSDLVAEVANDFSLKLLDIRLSQKLPEDLTGLPSLNDQTKKAEYNPFETFPMEGDPIPPGYHGWLIFLDELSSSTEEVMAAIYSLLLGHMVGEKKVHSKAVIVAAGNRSTDSAIARPLPDTLITRMLPVEMKSHTKDWLKWAVRPNVRSNQTVVEFIKKYPDLLLGTVDPKKREELETYPTPRGWGKMSKIVDLHEKNVSNSRRGKVDAAGIPMSASGTSGGSPITPAILALMDASVGTMAAKSFQEHYDEAMSLPFPWEVAQSPGSCRIPGTTIGKAKMTSNLADHFFEAQEQSRDAILQYMNRMDAEHSSLFAQMIKEKLGTTQSDQRLLEDIKKRLNVKDLDVGKNAQATVADPDVNFLMPSKKSVGVPMDKFLEQAAQSDKWVR